MYKHIDINIYIYTHIYILKNNGRTTNINKEKAIECHTFSVFVKPIVIRMCIPYNICSLD